MLLGAPGIATRSKDATRGAHGLVKWSPSSTSQGEPVILRKFPDIAKRASSHGRSGVEAARSPNEKKGRRTSHRSLEKKN